MDGTPALHPLLDRVLTRLEYQNARIGLASVDPLTDCRFRAARQSSH
jgi:hypothetical protein